MRASSAPEHHLLADALRGPSPQDAASSLAFWRARLERLPLRRIAARREARSMVIAWEERLRRAELERHGGGLISRVVARAVVLRGERPGALVRRAILVLVPRRLVTGALAVALLAAVSAGVVLGVTIAALF